MNDIPTLYERLRRCQDKLIKNKKEKGIKTEENENWQGDVESFFEANSVYIKDIARDKRGRLQPVFDNQKEMYSSSAVIKLAFALQLPEKNYKKILKTVQKNKVEL